MITICKLELGSTISNSNIIESKKLQTFLKLSTIIEQKKKKDNFLNNDQNNE